MSKLLGRFLCLIGNHAWTCRAAEGIPVDDARIAADWLAYWDVFATTYCRRCHKVSPLGGGIAPTEAEFAAREAKP